MFFFDMCNAVDATCNAVAAREDWKPKYRRLGCCHLGLSLAFDVLTSQRQTQSASDCVMLLESIMWDSQTIFLAFTKDQ